MRTAPKVELTTEDKQKLEMQSRSGGPGSTRARGAHRKLFLPQVGKSNQQIARKLRITEEKAARWRGRFIAQCRAGLEKDAPGRGRKPTYPPEIVAMVVRRTTQSRLRRTGADGSWLKRQTLSPTIGRIWQQHGLKPHLSRTFKRFPTIRNLPRNVKTSSSFLSGRAEHALVLCCDEKESGAGLDRHSQINL